MDNNFNQLSQTMRGISIGCAAIKEVGKTISQCERNVEFCISTLEATAKVMAQLGDNIKANINCCINAMESICRL